MPSATYQQLVAEGVYCKFIVPSIVLVVNKLNSEKRKETKRDVAQTLFHFLEKRVNKKKEVSVF